MKTLKKRNKTLGFNIKIERLRKRLTQFTLAELVNVSESTISLVERGQQTPSIFLVYEIAKVLNVDINVLLQDINQ